ncbi:MAG: hypothetical protein EOM37_07200 [Proteobacteria bacterium]|jgi:hypothetical protein|nr:hypothetical protein [Alphaproteobacteria bacterium]NCC03816.1 hypothetical protein [Pseudomonadota bacterium]
MAGISEDRAGHFRALALPQLATLKEKAEGTFAYVGVEGERDYVGPSNRLYSGWKIEKADEERLFNIFIGSLSVRDKIASANEASAWPKLSQLEPEVFDLVASHLNACRCKTYADTKYPTSPNMLAAQMQRTARASREKGADYDAAAVISPYGQPLAVCGSATDISPIRTAMVEVVRNYTRAQANIIRPLNSYLPNLRDCTIITLSAPDLSTEAKALNSQLMMGVYGSCMEQPITNRPDAPLKYIKTGITDSATIETWYESFPQLYRNIFVPRPERADEKLGKDFDKCHKLEESNHALCGQYPTAPHSRVTTAPACTFPGVTALV